MPYEIELFDPAGLRRARFDRAPLLEVWRRGVEGGDLVRGLLPAELPACGPGWKIRVTLGGKPAAEATVRTLEPEWGDTRKLILDRYVRFHAILAFEAAADTSRFDPRVEKTFLHTRIDAIMRELINHAPGPVHYTIAHEAYPDGAAREYNKLLARITPENALESGGIAAGQWVDSSRIDLSDAHAKDGDTLAGLRVDGVAWPDLRLMMLDCEETTRNSHAIKRHPEVAAWTDARYAKSGYALRALAARDFLQALLDSHGISHIELNPHRDHTGAFDDRVDVYGRYLGLVYGGGRCYNAALVETGHAEVYLYAQGRYLDPALALKEFFSYTGVHEDSIETCDTVLAAFAAEAPLLELLATLAYAAPGHTLHLDPSGAVQCRDGGRIDRVHCYNPLRHSATVGAEDAQLANVLTLSGNPLQSQDRITRSRSDSTGRYGERYRALAHHAFNKAADLDALAQGLLDDLAYPGFLGEWTLFGGDAAAAPGQCVELRGHPLRRLHEQMPQEHGGRFPGRLVARVHAVRHRIHGRHVTTTLLLGPPLRSVRQPLYFLTRGQRSEAQLYALRLDDTGIALDLGFQLD